MGLTLLAWTSLAVAAVSAIVLAVHETRHPQRMAVMNLVWPLTALYFSVAAVWAYFRLQARRGDAHAHQKVDAAQVAVGTSHCGAGCALADIATEFTLAATGVTIAGSLLLASYLYDFLAAWALGIVFQYFAIKPMRPEMSAGQAILAAIKADTLSILAFQVGMYALMFVFHRLWLEPSHITAFDPRYWFAMQGAMIAGFATSFPMNRWLIHKGWKEAM